MSNSDQVSASGSTSSSEYNQTVDRCSNLQPKVHILQLPDFMVNSEQPASYLDQFYSFLSDNLLKRKRLEPFDDIGFHFEEIVSMEKNAKKIKKIKKPKIPSHWLNVRGLNIFSPLHINVSSVHGVLESGERAGFIFRSEYENEYYYKEIHLVKVHMNYLELFIRRRFARTQIMKEIDKINMYNRNNFYCDYIINYQIPILEYPSIFFLSNFSIVAGSKWLKKLKILNGWPKSVQIAIKRVTNADRGRFWINLKIDSQVRTLIEENMGRIMLPDGNETNVIDDFNIVQCGNCFLFGHAMCDSMPKCHFCYHDFHYHGCPVENEPNRWYCQACDQRGHTIFSKECPTFIRLLQLELSKYNHRYRHIFLSENIKREECESILRNQF